MIISLVTAWIATICAVLTAIKYFAKKNKKLNKFFHRIHIPLGIVLIAAGLIHGLLAGNPLGTPLEQASFGGILFTLNAGTVCFILSLLLGLTYLFRKILKKNWMILHRIFTVLFVAAIIFHIYQMGIHIPKAISSLWQNDNSEKVLQNESLASFSGSILKDGTYQGTAEGYNGDITVSVVVSNGEVTEIIIEEENDTPQFFERAKEIIASIIDSQSLEVDGISGATISSKGIQNAVYNALQNAVESGELKTKDIPVTEGKGRGHKKQRQQR